MVACLSIFLIESNLKRDEQFGCTMPAGVQSRVYYQYLLKFTSSVHRYYTLHEGNKYGTHWDLRNKLHYQPVIDFKAYKLSRLGLLLSLSVHLMPTHSFIS